MDYYAADDSHFLINLLKKDSRELHNVFFACSVIRWEDFQDYIEHACQDQIDKRNAFALRKSKNRKRGKEGREKENKVGREKDANCNSAGSVVGEKNTHAESHKLDSLGPSGFENRHQNKCHLGLCERSVYFSLESNTCNDDQLSAFDLQYTLAKDA